MESEKFPAGVDTSGMIQNIDPLFVEINNQKGL